MPVDETAATMTALVAATVRRHPERAALDLGRQTMTYRELWDLAGLVMDHVRAHDPDGSPVGLCAARTPLAFAGYVAALRLGATVVPLHPTQAVARTARTATAAGIGVVLADDTVEERLLTALRTGGARTIRWSDIRRHGRRAAPGDRSVDPAEVAYLLFTSGSTGEPKGVPIRHASAAAYLSYNIERYEVGPGSRLSHTFDLTFDPSVFDLFAAWGSGATVVVPHGNEMVSPARYVRERGITHWFSVPSAITLAGGMRGLPAGAMPDLRWSMFIGDQLTWDQARAWRLAAPNAVLENVYGPTELTVACAAYRAPADVTAWPATSNGTVPIGDVYPHLESFIAGENGQSADEGELCVRGVQRFPGYLDPARNVDSFLAVADRRATGYHGDGPPEQTHWYRTGDRVRVEDGAMVHLGRLDRQAQIDGCRVELGEIEAALRRHAGITGAIVFLADDQRTLRAVCTGSAVNTTDLTAALRAELPTYMIPARIEMVHRLPLTPNGKVDRRRVSR